MRILIEDGFSVQKGAGIGQYTRNLFRALGEIEAVDHVEIAEKRWLNKFSHKVLRRALYIVWLNTSLQQYLSNNRINIAHFTNYLVPFVKTHKAKYVVTIHDLTAWTAPETLPLGYMIYNRLAILHAIRQASLIITVSEAVKKELMELLSCTKNIKVIHNAVSPNFRKLSEERKVRGKQLLKKLGVSGRYILFVGTLEKRKNILGLLRAFVRLKQLTKKFQELKLVLVGNQGYGFVEISAYLDRHQLSDSIILTNYVREDELITLYNLAELFVYPSLYEGFGIPLLEAMACGVPIIANDIPSTREVVNNAAVLVNSNDEETFARTMLKVLENKNLRDELIFKSVERVREFSWDINARKHLEAYKELLGN